MSPPTGRTEVQLMSRSLSGARSSSSAIQVEAGNFWLDLKGLVVRDGEIERTSFVVHVALQFIAPEALLNRKTRTAAAGSRRQRIVDFEYLAH